MNTGTVRFFVLAILLGLLAGCLETKDGKPFIKEKGVYDGKVDELLDDETRQQLRRRMTIQRGGGI